MGWSHAVKYFDTVAAATASVLDELTTSWQDRHDFMLRILTPLAEELDKSGWDAHRESDYWDEFKWYIWPEEAQEEHEEMLNDAYGE